MQGFKIGKVFGIKIGVDPSWLLIFFLVTDTLAVGLFPRIHPEWRAPLVWSISILTSVLFFCSVLVHELAHSLVAKAQGIKVREITLFLFGGVSNIEGEPKSPMKEFLMAVVGPLTSIALGFLFLLIPGRSFFINFLNPPLAQFSSLSPIDTIFVWLGPINILLGVFNLVPGFPLDGGRIFRSIIWGISRKFILSTQIATGAGQLVGWSFILAGVAMVFGIEIPFFGTGLASGLWIAFIGWFLNTAAKSSLAQVMISDVLRHVPVQRLMHSELGAPAGLAVADFVNLYMAKNKKHTFSVIKDSNIEGFVSAQNLKRVPKEEWDKKTVEDIMTPLKEVEQVNEKDNASNALQRLLRRGINEIAVVRKGKIIGMISRRDIFLWLNFGLKKI